MTGIFKKISNRAINSFLRKMRKRAYGVFDFFGALVFMSKTQRAYETLPVDVKKILIIRLDRIGDLILSTPAIRALRYNFPQAKIHLLINEYTKDLVAVNPNIDRIIIYKKDNPDSDYDLAVSLQPGLEANYAAFKSRAGIRIGYTGSGGGFFLTHGIKDDRHLRVRHEVDSALEIVKALGCRVKDKYLEISITTEGEEFAERFLSVNGISASDLLVVIHPGARQEYLRWDKKGFAEVTSRLIKEDKAKVILVGSDSEKKLIEEVAGLSGQNPVVAFSASLTGLISLIKRAKLFIGNSTGPMHIAAGLGVRVVAIFGPVHPLDSYREWGPWSERAVIVSKNLNCRNCHPSDCKSLECMRQITPEEVLKAVRKIINS